jgi:hypothetical protein
MGERANADDIDARRCQSFDAFLRDVAGDL